MPKNKEEYVYEVRRIIGGWLKQMREDKGYTMKQLAEILEIDEATVSKIEAGKWNFGIDTVTEFAQALDFYVFFVPKDSDDELAQSMRKRWTKGQGKN
jgi:transcriptional regulator with XRE-family HTH domain